jgi:kumamolisin
MFGLSLDRISGSSDARVGAIAAVVLLLALDASAQPSDAAAPSYVLAVPSVMNVRDLGPLAATVPVHVGIVLSDRHADELERDVALVSTKGSRLYHHFVSREQWNDYFAPSSQSVGYVCARLLRAGFRIERVAANRGIVDAVAPASVVARYFSTSFRRVAQPFAGERFRNASAAYVPPELQKDVAAVTGLDTIERYRLRPYPHVARAAPNVSGTGDRERRRLFGPDGGVGPAVMAWGFRFPSWHGYKGAGTTVGISIPDDFFDSDTATFLKYFGIEQTGRVRRFPVDGGYPSSNFPTGEATLDTETIASLAPDANIDVYEFPDFTNRSITDAFNQVVSDDDVDSISNSFAGCEQDDPIAVRLAWNQVFQQAALKGITFIFSSGDDGAYPCPESSAISSPASQPYVTAVGGTHIDVSPTGYITTQTATWPVAIAQLGDGVGSGGGVSMVWPLPWYQSKVRVSRAGRNVPDLTLAGDIEDSFYFDGYWTGPVGGTSWSAPAFNAMLAEVNEVIASENGLRDARSGFVNPSLYAAYGSVGALAFTDITRGNNSGFLDPGTLGYHAGVGYDLATGLGAPIGLGLSEHL